MSLTRKHGYCAQLPLTPAPWESPPAVFNILQTGTRKA
ncbi:hypothetical protein Hamer_G003173, partial [Homarus americanus]